ncbi:3-hydroxyacyl-CoA dehydrogenase NAD-binding domain-containing protein [Nocardia xishanensis]|uniref:enoyl-CoA hydratase n=1 Tax=Nocardia xishanensis TaxID=238964 RepID=A0ABW7XCF1_9NOCA
MNNTSVIDWQRDGDIVVLTLNDRTASANTMTDRFHASLTATVDRLEEERGSFRGVILASAKKTFFAGGNLDDLVLATPERSENFRRFCDALKHELRRIETLGVPVVSAINGAALGGGLELTLATHYRIAVRGRAVLGLPEVGLGLLPAAGGVTRTVRLLGLRTALDEVLLSGTKFSADAAAEIGLVDKVVATAADLVPTAKDWIAEHPDARQPWDTEGYEIPGGMPSAAELGALSANLRKRLRGAPLPAPRAILAAAVEGAQTDFDAASLIETRYCIPLVTGQTAKNMIQATFFDLQTVNNGANRPGDVPAFAAKKVGVIGAGMMGSALAYVCARAGIDVILRDVTIDAAVRGKKYAEKLEARAVEHGERTSESAAALLDRIVPTDRAEDFAGVDFVVEAVFEDVALKQRVLREVQEVVDPNAVLGSNTSTLPITTLAEGVVRPGDFIGVHFFSPVDKMPLVEIITGKATSRETLAKAFDFSRQIGKTPIVVNDSRGFFTSRVISTFLNEAAAAIGEGIPAALVEQAGAQAGYPSPPLQLIDDLTLTLPRKIREEKRAAMEAAGQKWVAHGSDSVINRMIDEFDRKGRSTGTGFYDYDESGRRARLWPGLRAAFGPERKISIRDLQERMLFAEAIETVRCLDEGVLASVADANIGSLYGIGFPSWTGGVLQYINGYPGGPAGFIERARQLADRYGSRFTPPDSLVARAAAGEFYR